MDRTDIMIEQYTGFALTEREENRYHDSYFHLTVWNPDEQAPEHHMYASTAWPSSPMGSYTVSKLLSATFPAVHEAVRRYEERFDRAHRARILSLLIAEGEVFPGDTVTVFKGRKVPKGTTGRVLTVEEKVTHVSKYGTWQTKEKFAFLITDSGAWTVNCAHLKVLQRGPIVQEIFDLAD